MMKGEGRWDEDEMKGEVRESGRVMMKGRERG